MVIHYVIRLSLLHEIRRENMEIPNNTAQNAVELVHRHLRVLHQQGQTRLREIEQASCF